MVKLDYLKRTCKCGNVSGYYKEDGLNIVVSETAKVIGVDNHSLAIGSKLIDENPSVEIGPNVLSWVFPHNHKRITRY